MIFLSGKLLNIPVNVQRDGLAIHKWIYRSLTLLSAYCLIYRSSVRSVLSAASIASSVPEFDGQCCGGWGSGSCHLPRRCFNCGTWYVHFNVHQLLNLLDKNMVNYCHMGLFCIWGCLLSWRKNV